MYAGDPKKWQEFENSLTAYMMSQSLQYKYVLDHDKKRYNFAAQTGPGADDDAQDTNDDFKQYRSNYYEVRNHKVFNILRGLIKHNATGSDVVWRFTERSGNSGDGWNLWIELCAYFQMGANTLNALTIARDKMFEADYNGTRRGMTIHEYVHHHQTYHTLDNQAPADHRITWGKAARSELLLKGITAPHLAIVKGTLEMKTSELSFDEIVTQIVNSDTTQVARRNEERDDSYAQMANTSGRGRQDRGEGWGRGRGGRESKGNSGSGEKNPPARHPPRADLPPMLSPEAYRALSKEEKDKLQKDRRMLKRKIQVAAPKRSRNNNDESAEAYTPPKPGLGPVQGPELVDKAIVWKDPIAEILPEDPTRKGIGFLFGQRGQSKVPTNETTTTNNKN
jgi:hypothetical protein